MPDALLLDMRMTGSGGLDVLRRFRADDRFHRIPVSLVTGDHFLRDAVLAELSSLGATVRYSRSRPGSPIPFRPRGGETMVFLPHAIGQTVE